MRLRDRFAHRPGRARPHRVRTGALTLALVSLLLFMAYTKSVPLVHESGSVIGIELRDATHLQAGSDVRVAGVSIGKVEDVALADDASRAVARLRLRDGSGVQVHRDARAAVWWRTVLGRNTYVELDPGTAAAGPLGGGTIPLRRTTVQEELDQVASAAQPAQRRALRSLVGSFDRGFSDRRATRRTIDAADRLAPDLRRGVQGLRGGTPGDLTTLVREASRTMGAVGRRQVELGETIDRAVRSLSTVAARGTDVGTTLATAPSALAETRTTLVRLDRTLDALDPLTAALRPGARRLSPAARALTPVLSRLDRVLATGEPTLRDLRPAVVALRDATPPATSTVRGTAPTVDRLNAVLLPWLRERDDDTGLRNYESIGPAISTVDSAGGYFDANGHVVNFQTFPDERTGMSLGCILRLTDPSATLEQKLDCRGLGEWLAGRRGSATAEQSGGYDRADDEDVGDARGRSTARATAGRPR